MSKATEGLLDLRRPRDRPQAIRGGPVLGSLQGGPDFTS